MEVLLYGEIYSRSSIDFINGISAIDESDELTVRLNTNGGDVMYGYGMAAKYNEFKGTKKIKVDGAAYSMGACFLAYTDKDNIEALDVSDFMIHRAAFPIWYEELMSDPEKENLKRINASLFDAFKSRINVDKFKEISGHSLKDVFSMDKPRIDVFFNAQQAKQIGLIGKIIKITPTKKAEISAISERISAKYMGVGNPNNPINSNTDPINTDPKNLNNNKPNPKKMTKEEFQREHPEAYAAIVKEGVTAERDRCGSYLAYINADKDAVINGIKSGEPMSATVQAELNIKIVQAMSNTPKLDEKGNPIATVIPAIETTDTPATPKAKTVLDEIRATLMPKKEN
jgi:ATP-dependent protease ClpP protease subunit